MTINEELKKKYPWKVQWTNRAFEASKFIPEYSSVVDLGGGMGGIYNYLKTSRYLSIDLEKWNDHTVKADFNKGQFPDFGLIKRQFVICLGTLEYIENPEEFLSKIDKYANRFILTYRRNTKGGMERKNNMEFEELRELLLKTNWEIVVEKKIRYGDRLFFCKKIYGKD